MNTWLAQKALKAAAASGSILVESGASWLAGPWLNQGLMAGAASFQGPGRALIGPGGGAALSFDVDFKEDVAAIGPLLDILARLSLKASFALVGAWVERFPEEHRAIAAAGHEVLNHTMTHPDNEELDPDRHFHQLATADLRDQILGGHRVMEEQLGLEVKGFRAPHFGYQHTEAVYPVLRELGYAYSTSTMASRSPGFGWPVQTGGGLWEIPVTVCPRHPFSCFDTWHYVRKTPSRHQHGDLEADLVAILSLVLEKGLFLSLYLDPRDVAAKGGCRRALEMIAASGLETAPYRDWLAGTDGAAGSEVC